MTQQNLMLLCYHWKCFSDPTATQVSCHPHAFSTFKTTDVPGFHCLYMQQLAKSVQPGGHDDIRSQVIQKEGDLGGEQETYRPDTRLLLHTTPCHPEQGSLPPQPLKFGFPSSCWNCKSSAAVVHTHATVRGTSQGAGQAFCQERTVLLCLCNRVANTLIETRRALVLLHRDLALLWYNCTQPVIARARGSSSSKNVLRWRSLHIGQAPQESLPMTLPSWRRF